MIKNMNIDCFVKNPSLIIELCREIIDRLEAESATTEHKAEATTMEAQLREIAKTIDRLEKVGVPIPDVLRAEKTRLAAVLAVEDEAAKTLEKFADSLGIVLRELRISIHRSNPQAMSFGSNGGRVVEDRLPRSVIRNSIIHSLQTLGGSASRIKVFKAMKSALVDQFLPGDLNWSESRKAYAWHASATHERKSMIDKGILRDDSASGTWELNEKFR